MLIWPKFKKPYAYLTTQDSLRFQGTCCAETYDGGSGGGFGGTANRANRENIKIEMTNPTLN